MFRHFLKFEREPLQRYEICVDITTQRQQRLQITNRYDQQQNDTWHGTKLIFSHSENDFLLYERFLIRLERSKVQTNLNHIQQMKMVCCTFHQPTTLNTN